MKLVTYKGSMKGPAKMFGKATAMGKKTKVKY